MTFCSFTLYGQRYMENLDRGLVAMRTDANSVLISWRIPGDEYTQNATYNLYRGSTLIASDLSVSNYVDATSTDDSYSVAAVIGGTEQVLSPATSIRGGEFFTIPVRSLNGGYLTHHLNDASVGDLDGDGEYEIVIKRLSIDESPASPYNHYLEAYELDGTFMWAIDLGPNLLHAVEVNFLVYDLDNDGKAEIATRTSDGMIDGLGNNIGDRDGDGQVNYRSSATQNGPFWFRTEGPDYISIFDGETGGEIAWDWYIDLAPIEQWGQPGHSLSQLGHRATKCMWAVAYTDGENPSFIISRGIYERIKIEAWHFRNGTLTQEWAWDSSPGGVATEYHGQGNHNLAVGDVDGDGRDEITYGAMAVDEYGNGLYSTGFAHGDAAHLADINPDIPGLEYFSCQEYANGTEIPGLALRNAETGTVQWANPSSGDIGRCMAADVDPNYKGMEIWGSDGSGLRSSTGQQISTAIPTSAGGGNSYNFGVWWDGDVQREILDRRVITKWNGSGTDRVATLYNMAPIAENNGTKSNPCLMADILGDWREEVIYRLDDNTGLAVFVTPFVTNQRMYTLMHDPNYRTAISWQNISYNQPPNLGFYFGGEMDTPPSPNIKLVNSECTPTAIVPYIGVDGGTLAQVNEVSINLGSSVTFSPQPDVGGSWSWSGCGTSGTSREQTFTPTESCLATVIYTNDSGCVSSSNFTVNVKKNILHYPFDETGGTTAFDNSGNGNDGTVSGGATFSSGKIDNALVLDGTDDYVSAPAGVVDNLNRLTVTTWVYWNGGNPWQRIFDFGNGQTENMFLTASNSDGALQFSITENGITQNVVGPTLPFNKWSHLAVTINSNAITLYLNGDNVAQYSVGSTIKPSDFNPVQNYIGKSQWPDPLFNGLIDDFRIYNYVFSDQEIAELDVVANEPPTVSITSPSEGAQYLIGSDVTINASAADTDGDVAQVEFFVDGESIGVDTTSPYSVNWTIGDGNYSLTAVATDDDLVTTTSTAVSVTGSALPNTPPTVSITNPINGSSYDEGTIVSVAATAADVDGSVSQVEFFANGVSIGVDNVSPYSVNWTIGVGGYSLTAVATDDDLATTTSIAVLTTGNAIPKSPTVSITSPADGSSYDEGTSVSITASASDSDGNVTQVEFFVDGVSLGIDSTSPYSVNWTIGTGSFSLTAVATDNDEQTTTSTAVNVTGSCAPSTITPYYNVNSTGWFTGTDITVNEGDNIVFGPHPTTGGSWSWSGCGTSGTSREQSVTLTSSCSATATHTNDCGGVSSVTYNITVIPASSPYMAVDTIETSTVSAAKGKKYGAATVTVVDDQSNTVSGATVFGTFSGSFGESVSGVTDANGVAYLQTTSTEKGNVVVDFCVDDITHSNLPYDATQNQITCTGSSAKMLNTESTDLGIEPLEFKLYPNPTSQYLNITLGLELVGMDLVDINGRLVQTNLVKTGDKRYQLDMSNLEVGVYLLIVKTSESQINKRVIKL
ncbi:Ig-like domain-containing protein [Flavobacteriaceae bacterium GSB9]|nr:Ig-like domain-containing protein [Flavobacteriaceae bacterium GSB9]